jgi:hypothetical protein
MSGVAGAERVRSREDYAQFTRSFSKLIYQFCKNNILYDTGSYAADETKQTFGDIDLVVNIPTVLTKTTLKKSLVEFFHNQPEDVIVPFSNPKYLGRRTYNSGEIVTVRYYDATLGYSVQIDSIIARDYYEANFKRRFLNMPASIQGLVLGLVKVALLENSATELFPRLGITADPYVLDPDQEYEFNLSSSELQLRRVQYEPGTYKQASREILWASTNFLQVHKLLSMTSFDYTFVELVSKINSEIKNPRSRERIKGLFASMISVKSGEVGTEKGAEKEKSLTLVQQTFS